MSSAASGTRRSQRRSKHKRKSLRSARRSSIRRSHQKKVGFTEHELTEVVKKYFTTFTVHKDYYDEPTGAYTFEVKCTGGRPVIFTIYPPDNNAQYPSNIVEIDYLTKCSEEKGATILRKIIEISREWGVPQIHLSDSSAFGCGIPLSIYHILKDGFSWYHKFGFVSDDDEKEIEHNEEMRNKPLSEFIRLILCKPSHHETPEELLSRWHKEFPESERDPTIHAIIQKIHRSEFMDDCDDPRTKLVEDTLNYAKKCGILYKTKLHLIL
jgi:hypothetical protein